MPLRTTQSHLIRFGRRRRSVGQITNVAVCRFRRRRRHHRDPIIGLRTMYVESVVHSTCSTYIRMNFAQCASSPHGTLNFMHDWVHWHGMRTYIRRITAHSAQQAKKTPTHITARTKIHVVHSSNALHIAHCTSDSLEQWMGKSIRVNGLPDGLWHIL